MKKTSQILPGAALLFASLLIGGCKKSTSSGNNTNVTYSDLVANATYKSSNGSSSTTTVYTYTYDSQGRLIEQQQTDGTPAITYTYGSAMVTEVQGTTTTIYTLNSAGYAASDNQGNTYTFDANGYRTSVINTDGSSSVWTITNKNVTTLVQTSSTGVVNTYAFAYSTSLYNTLRYGNEWINGQPATNTLTSETYDGFTYPITYTFDSHGRVSSLKIVSGATTLTRNYTYIN
ncbi:MAG TPA: hypothetical protein VKT28_19145 [Puia sp.]|nr:hypothetical protein [Puia sp.]